MQDTQFSLEGFLTDIDDESTIEVKSEEPKIYSVSELNLLLQNQLEKSFPLVWLKGEISNFKPHTSGHYYFSLKDQKSQINAIMFKGHNAKLKFKPENGMEVMIRGRLSVYVPRGTYQIYCELMEPVGVGALQIAFEQLKKKLQSEGLFDESKKKLLPSFPQKLAIVTSPTGAAIRDMLNVLGRRCKSLEITIFPCSVQGNLAAGEISENIKKVNQIGGFDVIIVGRGGGSIEDLWAFNEEIVARSIYESQIPIISAVGHEIDFTISDFVADLRAPTPSAAAELVVKNTSDLIERIEKQQRQIKLLMDSILKLCKQNLIHLAKNLVNPQKKLQEQMIRNDELTERLENSIFNILKFYKHKSEALMAVLDSLSPLQVVKRGYSILSKNQKLVKSKNDLKINEEFQIQLSDGNINAQVTKI